MGIFSKSSAVHGEGYYLTSLHIFFAYLDQLCPWKYSYSNAIFICLFIAQSQKRITATIIIFQSPLPYLFQRLLTQIILQPTLYPPTLPLSWWQLNYQPLSTWAGIQCNWFVPVAKGMYWRVLRRLLIGRHGVLWLVLLCYFGRYSLSLCLLTQWVWSWNYFIL